MNRETKIGMLTGLGVIILLGVLLSAYFEKDSTTLNQAAAMRDVGEHYRDIARAPLGVPTATPVANGLPVMMISGPGAAAPPAAFATTPADGAQGPVMAAPVSAVPSGTVADATMDNHTAAGTLAEKPLATNQAGAMTIYVPGEAGKAPVAATSVVPTGAPVPHTTDYEYTIAKGDTLVSIAKKFYHYATKTYLDKIVAANPKMLKDAKTPLVVGKKLVLPGIGPDGKPKTTASGSVAAAPAKAGGTVDSKKGTTSAGAEKAPAVKSKTYTVVQGDNLAKIAAKMMGSASKANQDKIIALNGIKNPDAIRSGSVLKIPV